MSSTREDHPAAIFAELRRIGVEPDAVGAPLIATGFTRRALLEWLREVPSGTGSDGLERRLDEHTLAVLETTERAGTAADGDAKRVDLSPSPDQVRWWPTTAMLDDGISLLMEEWDPVGLRLGGVPAEDLGEHAFYLFGPLLHQRPGVDALADVEDMIGAIEEHELGLRRSPAIHRRYLAARLREIVARHPLPAQRPQTPTGAHERIAALDAQAHGPPTTTARSWADAVEFLRLVLTARDDPERGREITPALLAELAAEMAAHADKMDGPMPEEVESFVREYAPSPASP